MGLVWFIARRSGFNAGCRVGAASRRGISSSSSFVHHPWRFLLSRRGILGVGAGLATGLWVVHHHHQEEIKNEVVIDPGLKEKIQDIKVVQVDSSSNPPFPELVQVNGTTHELLGVGVRTVSFLKFHVYTVGIYVAQKDKPQLLAMLDQQVVAGNDKTLLEGKLEDPLSSMEIFKTILNSNSVEMSIRICTSRQTDFGHLRDGFIRSVGTNNSDPAGIAQLRTLFSQSRSLGKNRILVLQRLTDGAIDMWCQENVRGKHEKQDLQNNIPLVVDPSTFTYLGKIDPSPVSTQLFLHYLAGKSPASPSARHSLVETLVEEMKK